MNRPSLALYIILVIGLVLPLHKIEASENSIQSKKIIFDFQESDKMNEWIIVNDGVMGGLSQSEIILGGKSTAIFQGIVSLENNGGFSSTRTRPQMFNLGGYHGMLLRLRGDGKTYQFRLRTNDRFDGISYRYHFKTESNTWMIIRVPFQECVPVFRGRILDNVESIAPKDIQQIGFLISDKQVGPFKLEIDWVKAYKINIQ